MVALGSFLAPGILRNQRMRRCNDARHIPDVPSGVLSRSHFFFDRQT